MYDRNWLDELIRNQVEESLTLDYKASGALGKQDSKKSEITKDVSAMANSAGGVLVYGVAEFNDKTQRHRPERIDAIVRSDFPKEWLEHVIQNIRPRLECTIVPIDIPPDCVVYVVDIPQSDTAHQATDKRYYKRFNFESVAMNDYEIRDVMGRSQYPKIRLSLKIRDHSSDPRLEIHAINEGRRYAKYINGWVTIPAAWLRNQDHGDGDANYRRIAVDNTVQDPVSPKGYGQGYGPIRYDPLLPSLSRKLKSISLISQWRLMGRVPGNELSWVVYADDAPAAAGVVAFMDLYRQAQGTS